MLTPFLYCRNTNALTRRKDEFSVIIIGLDGAGKTVRVHDNEPDSNSILIYFLQHRLSSRRSKLYIMIRRAYHRTRLPRRWARTVRISLPPPLSLMNHPIPLLLSMQLGR